MLLFECYQAAKVRWPGLFDDVDSSLENWIVDQMYTVSLSLPFNCFDLFVGRFS